LIFLSFLFDFFDFFFEKKQVLTTQKKRDKTHKLVSVSSFFFFVSGFKVFWFLICCFCYKFVFFLWKIDHKKQKKQENEKKEKKEMTSGNDLVPDLFNSILFNSVSPNFLQGIEGADEKFIDARDIRYAVLPPDLPREFDPRFPDKVPPEQVENWFYKNFDGQLVPVITIKVFNQARCGSCWAFAAASVFTDAARLNINRIYKDKACVSSPLFSIVFACNGETGLPRTEKRIRESKNKVPTKINSTKYDDDDELELKAFTTRNSFSPYYTVAFSPKVDMGGANAPPYFSGGSAPIPPDDKSSSSSSNINNNTKNGGKGGVAPSVAPSVAPPVDQVCLTALEEWRQTMEIKEKTIDPEETFGDHYPNCIGCSGNLIAFPLILMTTKGVPLLSDFPLHEWACFLGDKNEREKFCSIEYTKGEISYTLPTLYAADHYSYVTGVAFAPPQPPSDNRVIGSSMNNNNNNTSNKKGSVGSREAESSAPAGINSMSEWIKTSIYNYGPCVAGFQIYDSFMKFFRGPKRRSIYTARDFIDDIKSEKGVTKLGGHAISIVGWGGGTSAPFDPLTTADKRNSDNSKGGEGGASVPPYWVMRNSWGEEWGDDGFFRVEQDIDKKLEELERQVNLIPNPDAEGNYYAGPTFKERTQFEGEFGALYFNPGGLAPLVPPYDQILKKENNKIDTSLVLNPINNPGGQAPLTPLGVAPPSSPHLSLSPPTLSSQTSVGGLAPPAIATPINLMRGFFQEVPNIKCVATGDFPEILKEMSRDCNCRCGFAYDETTKKCERVTKLAGAKKKEKEDDKKESNLSLLFLLLLLLLLLAFLLFSIFSPMSPFSSNRIKKTNYLFDRKD
jgi:Ca2+/Na+ antiporter